MLKGAKFGLQAYENFECPRKDFYQANIAFSKALYVIQSIEWSVSNRKFTGLRDRTSSVKKLL